MEQRRGPGKPFHSAGGIRGGILPALLRDAQAEFRTGAQASWQKKRLRAASSALVGPVRAALEADGEIVRRLAGRYACDALQLGRALNDYYHHEQPPGAFADLQERIGRTARTLRRGVLNEHGLQGSEERGETFAKTCADRAVRGLRRRVLASLIMAMNRDERGCLAFRQDNFALRGKTRTVESKIRAPRRRSDKKPENAGEAVEKAMQRAIEGAPRLAQDTGSRVLADATVDVAAEHDMLAVWRAATGECDYCRKLDGKPVDMGDGRGVHMRPPAHDGCTCTVELTARNVKGPAAQNAIGELTEDEPHAKIDWTKAEFLSEKALERHFEKHSDEFPGKSAEEYLAQARLLLQKPLIDGEVEELVRGDNSISRYEYSTNTFVATSSDGKIRTFFRPIEKEAYWIEEHERNK